MEAPWASDDDDLWARGGEDGPRGADPGELREDDAACRVSHVRSRAAQEPSRDAEDRRSGRRHDGARDSVDRYLADLGGTARITPAEEVMLAERLLAACTRCMGLAREAGVRAEIDDDICGRDAIIAGVTRLWRLLDEHGAAASDPRRTGMVRVVEEELGCDGPTLSRLRCQMAPARDDALRARQTMTQANLALVVHVAKTYRRRGVPMADLIQEGNISLMRAVAKFDPTRGARLGTYATAWLHRSMRRTVRSLSRTVRLPESAKDARSRSVPIDEPVGASRLSLTDVLCEDDAVAPDALAAREEIRELARQYLSCLSASEAKVVRRRFGIESPGPLTLREIGMELGVTRERVRQIEKSALGKLRRRMCRLAPDAT